MVETLKMKTLIEKILFYQAFYSNTATDMMKRRGELIRHELPAALSSIAEENGLEVEGRDGTGQKSKVPWVRIFHPELSPNARDGWYVVYLFNEDASGFSCSLNQGTTTLINGVYVPDDDSLLMSRVNWAKEELKARNISFLGLAESIDLGSNKLAVAYQKGNVVGFEYGGSEIPDDKVLFRDLERLISYLKYIYASEARIPVDEKIEPAVATLTYEIDDLAGKSRIAEAPRRTNAVERQAIELHAMDIVWKYFSDYGWSIEDTHKNKPYDFIVRKDQDILYIEVKGTTSLGETVILTPNEVRHHQSHYPNTCLAIVKNIILENTTYGELSCTGGILDIYCPWKPNEADLKPMAFEYFVPSSKD